MSENEPQHAWRKGEGYTHPPFIGELVKAGRVERRAVLSYTTLESAIWAAEGEGFNRIVNDKGLCARTRAGKLPGDKI